MLVRIGQMGSGWGSGSFPEQAAEPAQGSMRPAGLMGAGCFRGDGKAFPGDWAGLAAGQ